MITHDMAVLIKRLSTKPNRVGIFDAIHSLLRTVEREECRTAQGAFMKGTSLGVPWIATKCGGQVMKERRL